MLSRYIIITHHITHILTPHTTHRTPLSAVAVNAGHSVLLPRTIDCASLEAVELVCKWMITCDAALRDTQLFVVSDDADVSVALASIMSEWVDTPRLRRVTPAVSKHNRLDRQPS